MIDDERYHWTNPTLSDCSTCYCCLLSRNQWLWVVCLSYYWFQFGMIATTGLSYI